MATFKHTTTWQISIGGRSVTYSFTYDIEDVYNVQFLTKEAGASETFELNEEPSAMFIACKEATVPVHVTLTENTTPSGVSGGYLNSNELFASHQATGGGYWQDVTSSSDDTLEPLDSVSTGGIDVSTRSNFDLLILHQGAS